MTDLSWSLLHASSRIGGSFLKATSDTGPKKIYYKLSNYDVMKGVIGHECVNELIVDRLLTLLGVEHEYSGLRDTSVRGFGNRHSGN